MGGYCAEGHQSVRTSWYATVADGSAIILSATLHIRLFNLYWNLAKIFEGDTEVQVCVSFLWLTPTEQQSQKLTSRNMSQSWRRWTPASETLRLILCEVKSYFTSWLGGLYGGFTHMSVSLHTHPLHLKLTQKSQWKIPCFFANSELILRS